MRVDITDAVEQLKRVFGAGATFEANVHVDPEWGEETAWVYAISDCSPREAIDALKSFDNWHIESRWDDFAPFQFDHKF